MSYSFVDARRGGETPEGFLYTYLLTGPELEAIVDRMIDPKLAMTPMEGDPPYSYPPGYENDPELRESWEQSVLEGEVPLGPLYLLPEGSQLHAEWFRRAEILKAERKEMRRVDKGAGEDRGENPQD